VGTQESVEADESRLRLRVVLTGAKFTDLCDVDVSTCVESPERGQGNRDGTDDPVQANPPNVSEKTQRRPGRHPRRAELTGGRSE